MNDRQTLRIPSWIRGFHVYKDWWTPTCGEILPLQPEPENAEDKNAVAVLKESRVIGHIPYHLANTKDRTGIITHFISKPTNRGSVEVSGKAVNRGGGLGMEIRGGEWYLEKRESRKILAGSRNLESVFGQSRSLVFSWFAFTLFESRNFSPKSLGLGFLTRISASRRVSDFTIRHP